MRYKRGILVISASSNHHQETVNRLRTVAKTVPSLSLKGARPCDLSVQIYTTISMHFRSIGKRSKAEQ